MRTALKYLMQALHPSHGTACLVLAKRKAFFPQVHQIFFEHCTEYTLPPYLSAESVVTALEEMGAMSVIRELPCTHTISIREDRLLEQYLQQSVHGYYAAPEMAATPQIARFLRRVSPWRRLSLPHPYWLILSMPSSRGAAGKHRLQNYLTSVTYSRQPR